MFPAIFSLADLVFQWQICENSDLVREELDTGSVFTMGRAFGVTATRDCMLTVLLQNKGRRVILMSNSTIVEQWLSR